MAWLTGCAWAPPPQQAMMQPGAKPVPPVALAAVEGLPPAEASRLKQKLSAKAAQFNVGVVDGQAPGAYQLSAKFRSDQYSLAYQWELHDEAGQALLILPGSELADASPQADDAMQHIANGTAEAVAYKLASLGYGARVPPLTEPPPEYFDRAGPGAGSDIDQETLNGPQIAQQDTTLPVPGAMAMEQKPPESTEDSAKIESAVQEADGRTVIRAVAVVPVKGAPGNGNQELTEAMRNRLRKAGWSVLDAPRADALTVAGEVGVARADGGNQRIALRWNVATAEGKTLGDVKQANAVPAGSLDSSWGDAATAVVEAAASGIFDLVSKYR